MQFFSYLFICLLFKKKKELYIYTIDKENFISKIDDKIYCYNFISR